MKKEQVEELCPCRNMVGKGAKTNQLQIPMFDLLEGDFQGRFFDGEQFFLATSGRQGVCKKG